ncbi:hypothetical protein ACO0K3_03700 [Undibacterium sp. Rencai35W]|uniref:DUF7940 domain-containing protein n=1 Tax=Undibacterium sp. Rencai35W TaxID=3413046 RepID=UPI003BF406C3
MIIPEWKRVLRYSWSVRFALLSGFLSALESILPLFSDIFPRGIFAVLSMLSGVLAAISRFVLQKKVRNGK